MSRDRLTAYEKDRRDRIRIVAFDGLLRWFVFILIIAWAISGAWEPSHPAQDHFWY